jgi:hypothetical protein
MKKIICEICGNKSGLWELYYSKSKGIWQIMCCSCQYWHFLKENGELD